LKEYCFASLIHAADEAVFRRQQNRFLAVETQLLVGNFYPAGFVLAFAHGMALETGHLIYMILLSTRS
jgi:hypothetical protein